MIIYRKSKSSTILVELIDKLKVGTYPVGSRFSSKNVLAKQYEISVGTAGKILRELGSRGYLSIGRGRHSVVQNPAVVSQEMHFPKPVGLIFSNYFHSSRWQEWVMHHLQKQLRRDGNSCLWLQADITDKATLETCCGFLVLNEQIPELLREQIRETGLPCVSISFNGPFPDCLFLDYQSALTELFVHLMQNNCRKLIFLGHSSYFFQEFYQWHVNMGFLKNARSYGLTEGDFIFSLWIPEASIGPKELKKHVLNLPDEMISIHISHPDDHGSIIKTLSEIGRELLRDYILVTYCNIPEQVIPGRTIEMRCDEVAAALLHFFYLRMEKNEPLPARILPVNLLKQNSDGKSTPAGKLVMSKTNYTNAGGAPL